MKGFVKWSVLLVVFLSACNRDDATSTVDGFLNAFKDGDFEEIESYMAEDIGTLQVSESEIDEEAFLAAISERFDYEDPTIVSESENSAQVKVEITSVDAGLALTSTLSEVLPLVFSTAFAEPTPESEAMLNKQIESSFIKHLSSTDTPVVTREVTLNLEKDGENNFKIIADDHFKEALLANLSTVEEAFAANEPFADEPIPLETEETLPPVVEDVPAENEATSIAELEQTAETLIPVSADETFDVHPIQATFHEVSVKRMDNLSEEHQEELYMQTGLEVGAAFNYLYINYVAENTSADDYIFSGVNRVIVYAGDKQEVIETYAGYNDFLSYDEDYDRTYYGQVKKEAEIGLIVYTPPEEITKIRLVIADATDNNTYEVTTEEQNAEFEITPPVQ